MQILLWIKAAFNLLVISKRLCLKWVMLEQETKSSLVTPDSSKEDLNHPQELDRRPWSDLPFPLLEQIADRLAMLELLSFRGTCKEWLHASKASAHHYQTDQSCAATSTTTTYQEKPWFLLYGKREYPNCNLYDPSSEKIYTKVNIPELEEDFECLASKGGWLLLYRNNDRSMFFFCPFSRARIDLPKLPKVSSESLLFHRIAAFSSPPTSPDCIVCVGTDTWCSPQSIERHAKFAVNVLRRGTNEWDCQHEYDRSYLPTSSLEAAKIGTFYNGRIHFLSLRMRGVSFSLETKEWEDHVIVLDCLYRVTEVKGYFSCNKGLDKGKLGLKDIDSLSICGTELQGDKKDSKDNVTCIFKEDIKGVPIDNEQGGIMKLLGRGKPKSISRKHYKAVWIHPRFFQLPPKYSW